MAENLQPYEPFPASPYVHGGVTTLFIGAMFLINTDEEPAARAATMTSEVRGGSALLGREFAAGRPSWDGSSRRVDGMRAPVPTLGDT